MPITFLTNVDGEGYESRLKALEDSQGSGENLSGADVTSIKTVLGNLMTIIKAQVEDSSGTPQGYNMDVSGLVAQNDALIAALGSSGDSGGDTTEKTLTSISATYSGGSVPVGTAVSALTGIVVTAHYSDGSTATVTGYTLSGSIAEGSNTITVSYGGKATTITVEGVASGEVEPTDNRYVYSIDNPGTKVTNTGGLETNGQYDTTGYIDIAEGNTQITLAVQTAVSETQIVVFNHFQWFNGNEFISISGNQMNIAPGNEKGVASYQIPSGATRFRATVQKNVTQFALYKGLVAADDVEF